MTLETVRSIDQARDDLAKNGIAPGKLSTLVLQPFPPLESGDRLTRAEFERRYNARPDIKKAELIEGVVYVPSPVRVQQHGEPHSHMIIWLGAYCAATPSVRISDNSSLRLDVDNMPQPDVCVWIDQTHGGQAQLTADDYLAGAPELIVEVAVSSATYDLHDKLNAYRRNGVVEYLILLTYEQRVRWHRWHEGQYVEVLPDEQGIIRSQVYPGLWFESARFWAGDLAGLLALVQQGVNSPEHADFVQRLADDAKAAS